MIKRVYLENWRSHAKSEFEFGKGTNVLIGKMGSGKSSVMNAISFALYGTFPELNARALKLEEIIMAKPTIQSESIIKVGFDYNGKNYSVERIVKRHGSNQAKLFEEDRLISGPQPTDVTRKIEELTEIPYELFSRGVYSEQNQIDFFLKLNASQRKEKFDDLLQLNRYERVRSNAISVLNRLKRDVLERKKWVEEQRKSFDSKQLEETEKKRKEKEEKIGELKKSLEQKKSKLLEVSKAVEEMEKKEKEFKFFKELIVKTETKIEETQKSLEEIRAKTMGKSLEEIEANSKELKIKVAEKEKQAKELKENEKLLQKELNHLLQSKGLLEQKAFELKESSVGLAEAKAECPVCRRKLEEHTKKELIDENNAERQKIIQEMKTVERKEKQAVEKISENEENIRLKEEAIEKLKEHGLELRELLEKAKNAGKKQQEAIALKEEKEKLEKQLSGLEFDEEKLQKKRNLATELKESASSVRKEISLDEEFIAELSQHIKAVKQQLEKIRELEETTKEIEGTNEKFSLFINALRAAQTELRTTLIDAVNDAMEDIWPRIYPYNDYVSARVHINEAGNYEIEVKEMDGKWVNTEGILSGGERSAAAITVRIAVSLVLTQNLGWLILDEPTHNLDSSTVSGLSKMMKEHLPELVEQIFIITHDREMTNAASSTLYILEREKDENGVTVPVSQGIE